MGKSRGHGQVRLPGTRDIVAPKMNANAEPALGGFHRFGANDLAGATPLRGRLACDFLGHLQKEFYNFALGETGIRDEEDASFREIQRLGPFFRNVCLPHTDAKSGFQIEAFRETTVTGKTSGERVHQEPPEHQGGGMALGNWGKRAHLSNEFSDLYRLNLVLPQKARERSQSGTGTVQPRNNEFA